MKKSFLDKVGAFLLWPGEAICDLCKVEEASSRQLLRLFINLVIYSKIAGIIIYLGSRS